ncbi:DNA damage-binding protein 1 [Clarias magur]|uniref:DNA damage-binding protein 1 n=1 Tax=Clarias magur TaxID=1594786 RepID=A0A8J4TXX4_CLAMG|nr:DNA damage-binding protein 1 [Clarias magur]
MRTGQPAGRGVCVHTHSSTDLRGLVSLWPGSVLSMETVAWCKVTLRVSEICKAELSPSAPLCGLSLHKHCTPTPGFTSAPSQYRLLPSGG